MSHITGVDFVALPTRNLPAAVAFYGEILALPCSVHNPEKCFAEFEAGGVTLSVLNAARYAFAGQPGSSPTALHVEDVPAARAELERRGVKFVGDTVDTGVCHIAVFHDPDGNTLLLHHRYAPHHKVTQARLTALEPAVSARRA